MTDIFIAPKKTLAAAPEKTISKMKGDFSERKTVVDQKVTVKNNEPYYLKKKVGFLSAFGVKPYGIFFGEQAEDEEIFLFLRRHVITNVPWLIVGFFLLLLPIFLFLIFNSSPLPLEISRNLIIILLLFYYLIVITFLFINYINWFFNISLVTDTRVVDINYSDIIYHDMAVTKLNLIEDIDYVQAGFFGSFFDFGNIYIQTAGAKGIFHFISIPRPARATEIIQNLMGGDQDVWD